MKRIVVLIFVLLSMPFDSYSQAPNNMAFPSPNNKFLGNINSGIAKVSVDLYTGTALVNIPICKLPSKDISIPVSISYTGGRGIKVQDYATMVGLGWQLNAGGSISRVVRCFPDEGFNGYLGTGQWGQIIKGNLEDDISLTTAQAKALKGYSDDPFTIHYPTADGEPDIYYVKTPYFTFQFTFDENGQPVFSNSTGIKIIPRNFYNSSIYYNSSFEVIDNKGNRYYFGSSSQSKEDTKTALFGTDYTFTTTWYLDKIVSYNDKDSILFNYASPTSNDVTYHYQSTTDTDNSENITVEDTPIKSVISSPKVIDTIISLLGEIVFSYATDRRDDENAPKLTDISLMAYHPETAQNELLKTYEFKYSYFGDPSTDPDLLRLKLDKINLKGNTSETSTSIALSEFTYNEDINLPSRKDLSSVDYFGYYSYSPFYRPYIQSIPPNEPYSKANILTGIKKRTGASYQINYELNTYYNASSSSNEDVGGLRVSKIAQTLPSGESIYSTYNYKDEEGHSSGEILSESYLINFWYGGCGVTKTLSESTSNYYDLNGNYVGYSEVTVSNQNGGYATTQFTNFSTPGCNDILNYTGQVDPESIPNIISSISSAYKRGLPLSKTVYNASGDKISQDIYSYSSLTYPELKTAWAYHWGVISFNVSGDHYSNYCSLSTPSTYWKKVENYRLIQKIHKDYDQNNPTNFIQTETNYTYAPDKRKIRSITVTDSKGDMHTQTLYYADDSNISMVTTAEHTALNTMVNENRIDVLIHKIDNKNGVIHQVHHSYFSEPYGYYPKIYLKNTQYYTGSTLVNQQFFKYNASSSQLISSYKSNGMPTSVLYGYHSSLPIARVVNATNNIIYTNQVISERQTLYIPPNFWGSRNVEFTTVASGTITVSMPPGSYLGSGGSGGVSCYFGFSLSGPVSKYGNICNSSSSNYSCSAPPTVSFQNMPAGTYTLTVYPSTNTATVNVPVDYKYPSYQVDETEQREFFYESFEEYPYAAVGNAHTGKTYWSSSSSYYVNYSPPNNRDYVIQWWSRSNGKWKMHKEAYSGSRSISGEIDDVRIFPSDAMMTTYTYDPLIGKTGEVGPAGNTSTYEYDGLGRLVVTKDGDGNIVSKTCYHLPGQPGGCKLYYNQEYSKTFTKNNCAIGYGGSDVVYTVPAHTYVSSISQQDANSQAHADANAHGQAYANTHGSCTAYNLYIYEAPGSSNTRPFHITISKNSQIVWEKTENGSSTDLPISVNIPNGTYRIKIDAFNHITATINGLTKTIQGSPESWQSISTPITIKLNY